MEIKGYTLHGDYYLADEVIPNKTWEEAITIKEIITLPNGKKVIAHTLSKEELKTISFEERKHKEWYWTSTTTPYGGDGAWIVYYGGVFNDYSIKYSDGDGGARLGFKNPF